MNSISCISAFVFLYASIYRSVRRCLFKCFGDSCNRHPRARYSLTSGGIVVRPLLDMGAIVLLKSNRAFCRNVDNDTCNRPTPLSFRTHQLSLPNHTPVRRSRTGKHANGPQVRARISPRKTRFHNAISDRRKQWPPGKPNPPNSQRPQVDRQRRQTN